MVWPPLPSQPHSACSLALAAQRFCSVVGIAVDWIVRRTSGLDYEEARFQAVSAVSVALGRITATNEGEIFLPLRAPNGVRVSKPSLAAQDRHQSKSRIPVISFVEIPGRAELPQSAAFDHEQQRVQHLFSGRLISALSKRLFELAVFNTRLHIRVCRFDEPA